MIDAEAKTYVAFGGGTVAVGCFKTTDPEELYCVSIKELFEAWPIGNIVPKDAPIFGQNQIILSFPTENQMIAVLAAFTNKSFEVVHNMYKAKLAKKEAM